MAELTVKERLQPSLLDRLTDDEPGETRESRERRVLSLSRLRDAVLRDLRWLLNCDNLDAVQKLERYPMVADSVLNYGLQPLAGRTASGIDAADLEQRLRRSILAFEPRLLPNTVIVRAIVREDESDHNALSFEIEGSLWAQPLPLSLFLKTEIDLENGNITIAESAVGKDA